MHFFFLDSPEQQHIIQNSYEGVSNVRRILVEQSSNLVAVPPNIVAPPPLEPAVAFQSRSSGSFPAVPEIKKLPPPPAPSPPLGREDKPPDTASPVGDPGNSLPLMIGMIAAFLFLIVLALILIIFRKKAAKTIAPWKSGLSGQLQKAFVTGMITNSDDSNGLFCPSHSSTRGSYIGVPKLNRPELEIACEDFSNIISTHDGVATLYKGTLSSGVEIAVASTAIASTSEWSKRAEVAFRKKV